MIQNSILPEGLDEETLGAYLEGTLDFDREIEVEQMLDEWDELQGFVNELADDAAAGDMPVDPAELPAEADFVLPYVSGLDDLVVVDDDSQYDVIEIDDWEPAGLSSVDGNDQNGDDMMGGFTDMSDDGFDPLDVADTDSDLASF